MAMANMLSKILASVIVRHLFGTQEEHTPKTRLGSYECGCVSQTLPLVKLCNTYPLPSLIAFQEMKVTFGYFDRGVCLAVSDFESSFASRRTAE